MGIGSYGNNLTVKLEVSDVPVISSGAGAPSTTPSQLGDIYIDTTNDAVYIAVDTTSSADWEATGAAGAGDLWSDAVDSSITVDTDSAYDLATTGNRFATAYVDDLDVTTNIVVGGTVDGRDLATDGSKLDAIEASADVTDEANVTDALDGATLTDVGTPASGDLILLQDASDSNILKVAQFSEFSGGGGASQLTDLSDVNTAGVTNRNVLVADGVDFESRALVEADISDLQSYLVNVVEDTTPTLGGDLDVDGYDLVDVQEIRLDGTMADNTSHGIFTDWIGSGEVFGGEQVCYVKDDGEWWVADPSDSTGATGLLAFVLDGSGTLGTGVRTAMPNSFIRSNPWNWTPGDILYLGTSGEPTTTAPSTTGHIIRVIGHAVTADIMYFNPSPDWKVAGTDDSSDTLTNKTIDGDNNTLSNLDLGNEVDWAAAADVTTASAFTSGDYVLVYEAGVGMRKVDFDNLPGAAGGLSNVVEDTTPQLGGELDAQGNNIIDLADVTFRTGASGGTIRTGTSNADKYVLQAYDVNDTTYRTLVEADAGNDVVLQIIGDYLAIEDATDTTKHVEWDISGATTSTATTLDFNQTAARTITFPDDTGTIQLIPSEGAFVDGDKTKLDGIEAAADVTDTANVTAAGALMDSEVTNLAQVKAFDTTDYATAAQGSTADSALQDVVDDTTPQLGADLDLNSNAFTIELTASATVALGDVCYINSSGQAALVDADAASTCEGQLVMAAESITATNSGTFVVFGVVGGFTSLTPGNVFYASTTGTTGNTATTTAPSATGDIVRKLYTVLTTTTIFFSPSADYLTI